MSEALEPAVDLAGLHAPAVEASVENVERRAAFVGETEVLHRHHFGNREAVVNFRQRDVGARVLDARLLVGALRGLACVGDVAAVPGAILHFPAMAGAQLNRLYRDRIGDAEPAGDVGRGDNRRGRAIGDAAAVEEAQRVGNHRRLENGVDVDGLAQMRLRIQCRVLMALPAHMRHRALEVAARDVVPRRVGAGKLCERAGRGPVGKPKIVGQPLGAQRQTAVTGVLELLDAERQGEIDGARRHRIDGGAQRFRAGRAHVLDSRNRNASQPQRMRQRQRAVADIDVVERVAHPRRLDPAARDSGVRQRLLEGLDHQVVGTLAPMLAEVRAAHADDDRLVLDAARHGLQPSIGGRRSGAAFQK